MGDTWFKEGGSAALTQAEAEYKDFITFFPDAPEAAEAKMKVADIYYQQMEKPDRDFTNAQQAEQEYRDMINMFPDSTLIPRAKQKLRDVQEVLAEREFADRHAFTRAAKIWSPPSPGWRRWPTPIRSIPRATRCCSASATPTRARRTTFESLPACRAPSASGWKPCIRTRPPQAYQKVITRYPMTPHVEDARDRLVAMNRPVPEPTEAAIAESDAEERSRQPLHFTDRTLDIIKHGPMTVEAVHVGEPTLDDPKRVLAPDITKENETMFERPSTPASRQRPPQPLRPPVLTSRRAAISPPTLRCRCRLRAEAPV